MTAHRPEPRIPGWAVAAIVATVVALAVAGWVLIPGAPAPWNVQRSTSPRAMTTPTVTIPTAFPVAASTQATVTLPVQSLPPGALFYADCTTVRAVGPVLRRGDPGYRPGLDRDGDGTACESPPVASTPQTIVVFSRPPASTAAPWPTPGRPSAATPPASPPPPTSAAVSAGVSMSVATTTPPTTASPGPVDTDPLPAATTPPPPTTAPPPVGYTDCSQVVADGRPVPLYPGQPGWNPVLDVDGDGLACEDDTATLPTTPPPPPIIDNCVAAWDQGRAPLRVGVPGWNQLLDLDGDGVACETDPRPLNTVAATTTSSSTTGSTGTTVDNGR